MFYLFSPSFLFPDLTFQKVALYLYEYISYIHTLIMFKNVNFEKQIWKHASKMNKKMTWSRH